MNSSFVRTLQLAVASSLGLPLLFASCSNSVECDSPQDQSGGYATCSNGLLTRPASISCSSELPRTGTTCNQDPEFDSCTEDADCTESPNGFCDSGGFDAIGCFCQYGCVTDDDCGGDGLCMCGTPVGYCVQANCRIDADCGEGNFCAHYDSASDCSTVGGFACTTGEDECAVSADCATSEVCTFSGGKRACVATEPCAIGRPFLVDDAPRLAQPTGRWDWQASNHVQLPGDPRVCEALAQRWTEIGLMEHASVAAFARFALQLLALGAPAELLARTARAMADETRHAEIAFGLAYRYGGSPVGPSELSLQGALTDVDAEALLRNVFREGCVGETVAAMEAREGAERSGLCVFEEIARDEAEHASLAWSSVRWLCTKLGAPAAEILTQELALAEARTSQRTGLAESEELNLTGFGMLSRRERSALREAMLSELVRPATLGLIQSLRASAPERVSVARAASFNA